MIIITVCYWKIFSMVKASSKTLTSHKNTIDRKINKQNKEETISDHHVQYNNTLIQSSHDSNSAHMHSSTRSLNKSKKKSKTQRRKDKEYQLLMTLLTIVIIFVFCWVPISVILITSVIATIPRELYIFAIWLAMCNSTFNSFVYGILNNNFREGYKRLFRTVFCCCCDRTGYRLCRYDYYLFQMCIILFFLDL